MTVIPHVPGYKVGDTRCNCVMCQQERMDYLRGRALHTEQRPPAECDRAQEYLGAMCASEGAGGMNTHDGTEGNCCQDYANCPMPCIYKTRSRMAAAPLPVTPPTADGRGAGQSLVKEFRRLYLDASGRAMTDSRATELAAPYDARLQAAESIALGLSVENTKLAAFKAFVHRRLDTAGVPTHPDGPHSAEGCRVGDRLDTVIGERDRAKSFANWLLPELDRRQELIKTLESRAEAAVERVRQLTDGIAEIAIMVGGESGCSAWTYAMIGQRLAALLRPSPPAALPAAGDDDAERAGDEVRS